MSTRYNTVRKRPPKEVMKSKKNLIENFNLTDIGYDFMGYPFKRVEDLSYHHIIPLDKGGTNEPENGAVLVRNVSHSYLHLIEKYDRKRFNRINDLLRELNENGRMNADILESIEKELRDFEKRYDNTHPKHRAFVVKDCYRIRLLSKPSKGRKK